MISIQKKKSTLFNGFVEIVEGGRRSVHIVWSLTQKKSSRLFKESNHASTQGVPALYNWCSTCQSREPGTKTFN